MQNIVIAIAADHAGFELKQAIISYLEDLKHKILDLGCFSMEAVDYPDYARKLCQAIKDNQASRGILICGTGIGMSIAANRFQGIRAALCTGAQMARMAREHNDANVLVLGARIIEKDTGFACVNEFLTTEFKAENKHQRRIDKL